MLGLLVVLLGGGGVRGQDLQTIAPMREQLIEVRAGWNAVFLEVSPDPAEPGNVFAGTPFDLVASYHGRPTSTQFVTDPGADLFRQEGWGVWYAGDRPDAVLTTLFAVHGQRAYLIRSRVDYEWRVRGRVTVADILWRPDAFNLVGFSVNSSMPPTFAEFFAGSAAHRHNRLYRLVEGRWSRVTQPDAASMRSGEAFWVYCDGASAYQGPLAVETLTRRGVVVGAGSSDVVLRNQTTHPLHPTVRHLAADGDPVPLAIVVQLTGDPRAPLRRAPIPKPDGAWSQALPPMEAGTAIRVPLALRPAAMQTLAQASLLKIETDLGTETWVPIVGIREDLEEK